MKFGTAYLRAFIATILLASACAPSPRSAGSAQVAVQIVSKQSALKILSDSSNNLSADLCYAVMVSSPGSPQLDRLTFLTDASSSTAASAACANRPKRLGMVSGLYKVGDSATIEVPVGSERRFDLIGFRKTPKDPSKKGAPANCSGTLRVEPNRFATLATQSATQKVDLFVDNVGMDLEATLIASSTSVNINPGDNSVSLVMQDGPDGVSIDCSTAAAAGTKLDFRQQPSDLASGDFFASPIAVAILDSNGQLVSTDNTTVVTLALTGAGSTMVGSVSKTAVGGLAVFDGLRIAGASAALKIVANAPDLASATSNVFASTSVMGDAALTIVEGSVTSNTQVTLMPSATGATEMNISNNLLCVGGIWEAFSASKPWTLTNLNANNIISVQYKNALGQISACVAATILHDNVAPSLASISILGASPTHLTTLALNKGTVTGSYTSYCILENTTVLSSCTWSMGALPDSYTVTSGDGNKTLSIYLKDSSGNVSSMVTSNTVTIDTMAPTIGASTTAITRSNVTNYSLIGTCSEPSTVAIRFLASGGTVLMASATCTSTWSLAGFNVGGLPDGNITIQVVGTDLAGNASSPIAYYVTKSIAIEVAPNYSSVPHWSQYVQNNGPNFHAATGAGCAIVSKYRDCLHSGEIKKVEVPGQSDCSKVAISESLGAFNWICDASTGTAIFYSSSLKEGKHLSDLIDFSSVSWKNNQVTITATNGALTWTMTSTASSWWTTPVLQPILDPSSTNSLTGGPKVFLVPASVSAFKIELGSNNLSLVVAPGAKLTMTSPVGLLFKSGTSSHWFEGTIDCNGVTAANAIYFQTSASITVLSNTKALGCQQGDILVNGPSPGLYMKDVIAADSTANNGITFLGVSNARLDNIRSYNNSGAGLVIKDGSNNAVSNLITTNNGQEGLTITSGYAGTANHNIVSNLTSAQNYEGVLVMNGGLSAANNVVHNAVTVNNSNNGIDLYTGASSTTVSQASSNHNQLAGILLSYTSQNKFTGVLTTGANAWGPCQVVGGSTSGLLDTTCSDTGNDGSSVYTGSTSDATLRIGRDLSSSFVGKANSNTANTFGSGGIISGSILLSSPFAWFNFDNPWRTIGMSNANALFTPAHRFNCDPYFVPCQIWDWSLLGADTSIRSRSGDGATLNNPIVQDVPCPTEVYGSNTVTALSGETYLKAAYEIPGDTLGNDNGLCESGETCMYAPNFGAYQGHGTLKSCTFQNGVISGVNMYGWSTNGF